MAEGRIRQMDRQWWSHTSAILAMQINTMPFRKGKLIEPKELNPYQSERVQLGLPITADSIGSLKAFLPPEKQRALAKQERVEKAGG